MVKRYSTGVVTGKLKQRGVPSETVGYVILTSLLENQINHNSVYLNDRSKKFMKLENLALHRDLNRFLLNVDSIDSLALTKPQSEVLTNSSEVYAVRYIVHVPQFLSSQNYDIKQVIQFIGEEAYNKLSHCGSKKSNPSDPASAYSVFLNHLRTGLEGTFNTNLTPK